MAGCALDPESHHLFTTRATSLLNSSLGFFNIPTTGPQLASGLPISPGSVNVLLPEVSLWMVPVFFLHADIAQAKGTMSFLFFPCILSLSFLPLCTGAGGQARTELILLFSHFGQWSVWHCSPFGPATVNWDHGA